MDKAIPLPRPDQCYQDTGRHRKGTYIPAGCQLSSLVLALNMRSYRANAPALCLRHPGFPNSVGLRAS